MLGPGSIIASHSQAVKCRKVTKTVIIDFVRNQVFCFLRRKKFVSNQMSLPGIATAFGFAVTVATPKDSSLRGLVERW